MNGILSEGTLRTQDLLRAFADALRSEDVKDKTLLQDALESADRIDAARSRAPFDAAISLDAETAGDEILDELITALDACADDGLTFGAHPGDGACFGFWPCDDEGAI